MKVSLLTVGKIKEKYFRDAIAEYEKRLSRYCKLEIVEVQDEKTPDHAGFALENQIKEKEAERLLKFIKEDAFVILLSIDGKKLDSVAFSEKLNQIGLAGKSHIQFIIGGSLGTHEMLEKRADFKISFSDMTFPHQLMRVILLEQIYRGYRILNNEPYHK